MIAPKLVTMAYTMPGIANTLEIVLIAHVATRMARGREANYRTLVFLIAAALIAVDVALFFVYGGGGE